MSLGRIAPPGRVGQSFAGERERTVVAGGPEPGLPDGFLSEPEADRLGVCTSGGGIRSASFCLGALQVLREKHVLEEAAHLACVSGGGYISIAHAVLISETLKLAHDPPPPGESDLAAKERMYFGRQPPWAPRSPEELNLRANLTYLAPGLAGRAWAFANLLYGTVRHLLPFFSIIYLAGFAVGIGLAQWLGLSLRGERSVQCITSGCVHTRDLAPFLFVGLGLLLLSGLLIAWRNIGLRKRYAEQVTLGLQYVSLAVAAAALVELSILVFLPLLLLWIHGGGLSWLSQRIAGGITAIAGTVTAVVAWVSKNRTSRWFRFLVPVAATLSAPIFLLVPFVGFVYWNAQAGARWGDHPQRLWLAAGSLIYAYAAFFVLDEVTSVPHMFYRERLARAFVGYRDVEGEVPALLETVGMLSYQQPLWTDRILFSQLESGTSQAKLPNLVVCSAVNLSRDLPAGRLAASFTFEKDLVGGPMTGYVTTEWMEDPDKGTPVTLPATMAISGAAVAPSMGKMTMPAVRFLMAMFNLRLGVWLPNPHTSPMRSSPRELRTLTPLKKDREKKEATFRRWSRPGALYVFREALGQNRLDRRFVYVTDGGHWENLGLVELLRRGCADIVCIDGSGGDAKSFGTLSEAISLARSDLGVDISIDLSDMRSGEDGMSKVGYAFGEIAFPDQAKTKGTLVYIRAVLTKSAPEEIASYAMKDKKFPNHPTTDQFFDDERFEAYRELGRHLTAGAIHTWKEPPPSGV